MALTVVAAYDVHDDGRRARLAALLQTSGDRIQYSVFLLTAEEPELAELLVRGRALLEPEEDSLYVFRQCASCWDGVVCVGQAHPPTQELFWAVW